MEEKRKTKHARNTSIDIAKSIGFFGLSITSFTLLFKGVSVADSFLMKIFHGKFEGALLFFLGASFFLMMKKYVRYGNMPKLSKIRKLVIYRAIFFLVMGYLLFAFWPYDILHIYALFLVLGIPVIAANKTVLWSISLLLITGFAVVFTALEFPSNWQALTTHSTHIFSPAHFLKEILYLGQYSILPYGAFFILGIWYGGLPLTKLTTQQFIFRVSLPLFLLIELGSIIFHYYLPELKTGDFEWLVALLSGTRADPPMPLFMISALAFSLSLVSGSFLLKEKYIDQPLLKIFEQGGRMIFSLLVFQALAGILIQKLFSETTLHTVTFTIVFNLLFVLLSVVLIVLLSVSGQRGPIETWMRWSTGYKRKRKES